MECIDMEPCSPVIGKKLTGVAREILFTIQKVSYASRSKLITLDLLLMKRGKILRKSLNDVVSSSHTALSCRPHDIHTSFVSPVPVLEYEFSCSSTPPRQSYTLFHVSRRRGHKPMSKRQVYHRYNTLPKVRDSWEQHVADTGSEADSCLVDRKAEEFIQKFYRQLRLQKWMLSHES